MKYCLNCNKIFEGRIKYCSDKCKDRFLFKKNYYKNNSSASFRKIRREKFDKWRITKRDRFNEIMLPASKIWQTKVRLERKEKGLCLKCGKIRDEPKYIQCSKCRTYNRNYLKLWKKN